jgi:hypothetical protein
MILAIFHRYGFDYIPEMMSSLENFVHRGKADFFRRGYMEAYFEVATKILSIDDQNRDVEAICACRLLIVMFQCAPAGVADVAIQPTIALVMKRLGHKIHKKRLEPRLLQVVSTVLYYNPPLTIAAFEALNFTSGFLTLLQRALPDCDFINDKKVVCLGLTGLLRIPMAELPDIYKSNLPSLWAVLVQTLKEQQHLIETRPDTSDEGEDEEEEGEGEEDLEDEDEDGEGGGGDDGFDDDQDAENEEDIAYLKSLKDKNNNFDVDDYLDNVHGDQDDSKYETPIDDVDAILHFHEVFQIASGRDPTAFNSLMSSLTEEVKGITQHVFEKSGELRAAES